MYGSSSTVNLTITAEQDESTRWHESTVSKRGMDVAYKNYLKTS